MALLKLDGINKVFNEGTPDEKIALDNINLDLATGDFVTTMGKFASLSEISGQACLTTFGEN